jgi:hypothetical protein
MTHQEGVEATVALGVEVAVPVLVKTVLGMSSQHRNRSLWRSDLLDDAHVSVNVIDL